MTYQCGCINLLKYALHFSWAACVISLSALFIAHHTIHSFKSVFMLIQIVYKPTLSLIPWCMPLDYTGTLNEVVFTHGLNFWYVLVIWKSPNSWSSKFTYIVFNITKQWTMHFDTNTMVISLITVFSLIMVGRNRE